MFSNILASIRNHEYWTYTTWMKMGLGYRKTAFGPLWILASPTVFVLALGFLFSRVMDIPRDIYVPHLTIGYITWLFIVGVLNTAPIIFVSKRSELLQGQMRLTDLVFSEIFTLVLLFAHHTIVIIGVFILFQKLPGPHAYLSLVGLALLVLNALWFMLVMGIIGARFRDAVEINQAIGRLFFFITPIIWVPTNGGGGAMGPYLRLNPFYHYLEVVRAPLMGTPISALTWGVVIAGTVIGFGLAAILYRRAGRQVPLWV